MKRILLLLLPVIALAAGTADQAEHKSKEETLGTLWQASLSDEKNGETEAALAKAAAYAKNGGDAYLASMRAGWLAYGQKKYDDAGRHYLSAARLKGNALSPRLGLLTVAQDKGDVAAAARAGEGVLQLEPTNYRALMAVAWGAYQAKDHHQAEARYQCVMALYPEDTDAISGAAWSAFYKGQKAEAKLLFRRLVSINPDYQYAKQGLEATR
ncbi:MAG: hypothetical protein WCK77_11265 [Verrucomicrobiota bacterium]